MPHASYACLAKISALKYIIQWGKKRGKNKKAKAKKHKPNKLGTMVHTFATLFASIDIVHAF